MSKRKFVYLSTTVANQMLNDLLEVVPNLPKLRVRKEGCGDPIDYRVYADDLKELASLAKQTVGESKSVS